MHLFQIEGQRNVASALVWRKRNTQHVRWTQQALVRFHVEKHHDGEEHVDPVVQRKYNSPARLLRSVHVRCMGERVDKHTLFTTRVIRMPVWSGEQRTGTSDGLVFGGCGSNHTGAPFVQEIGQRRCFEQFNDKRIGVV